MTSNDKYAVLCALFLLAVSACVSDHSEGMKRFKDQMDQNVAQKEAIDNFLRPNLLFAVKGVKEVRPGVMEYYFEPRHYWSEEVECKFIFVVTKSTIIGWRYNGKPENCRQAR